MSEVKRFDEYTCGVTEAEDGEYVKHSDYAKLADEAQALRDERDSQQRVAIKAMEELAALRARAVVVPERDARRMDTEYPEGWNDCRDELARINGKTVSASALDTLRRFATGEVGHLNNGHCPDDLEGRETRDPDCLVCKALIDPEKSK
ncbi:hypothetical protein OE313_01195 [Pseudomonas aeruginosa]|uniref:hypothetical protein n=1 Tax=Pseudomonas aeruginosa TaxID=287 RepID=UPI000DE831CF|nr:hypothetical protein [Pseudomonas aeruginosa]MCJ0708376.1 hypothetical protein [Pseudomonas aeruginosa]MCU9353992.1 hypothetical protein [Pseudomonas aeruginosa]MCU9442933.1 hypothetical protein [Pseudomonas aeruginosa]RCH02271.1 hypothetical protein CSC36_0282 [Pseudomonas aeruginosa]